MNDAARAAVEHAARESRGRLLAYLVKRSRDLAACEDALGDAFHLALEHWPVSGVPAAPEAWLLTAARRRLIDAGRREGTRRAAEPSLLVLAEEALETAENGVAFPDERLPLLFVCAHPDVDANIRTPLMLQVVLGLNAARIASAFLVSPSTMSQRLVRAKARIQDRNLAFCVPEGSELPGRLEAVLQAIYGAYGIGWDQVVSEVPRLQGLTEEAIELARLLLGLMPGQPEILALLALMLLAQSRRDARRDHAGRYVPLSQQDTSRWSRDLITEAASLLSAAAARGGMGRFQLEAAIQAVHARRAETGETDWEAIALLYEGLVRLAPTTGILVGRAAALGEARGAAAGWAALQSLPTGSIQTYQPYWALAGHLLARLNRPSEAKQAYGRAIGLSEDEGVRAYLERQAAALSA